MDAMNDFSIPGQLTDLKSVARKVAAATGRDLGWRPRVRARFQHVPVSEMYGALLDTLVRQGANWLDVGGGHSVLPSNPKFASELAARSQRLVVVDPSPNVHDNQLAHERHQCLLEDYTGPGGFDVATLRWLPSM